MKKTFFVLTALVLAPAVQAQDSQAVFLDTSGQQVGTATLHEAKTGVLIDVDIKGLSATGPVGFHIHEAGTCDPETAHNSAGGHFNPSGSDHGYLTETGPHAGDMPNLWLDENGNGQASAFNHLVTLNEGKNSISGRALIIHAGGDDYQTQPTGGAGDRLACAVIK